MERLTDLQHGTSYENAQAIVASAGFDPSHPSRRNSAEPYLGRGAYFYHGETAHDDAELWARQYHPDEPAVISADIVGELMDVVDDREYAQRMLDAASLIGRFEPKALVRILAEMFQIDVFKLPYNMTFWPVPGSVRKTTGVVFTPNVECIQNIALRCRANCGNGGNNP